MNNLHRCYIANNAGKKLKSVPFMVRGVEKISITPSKGNESNGADIEQGKLQEEETILVYVVEKRRK